MLILKLVFAVGLRVAGPPSDWITLAGADKIEYRWSRPANNSCLVEFRSLDPIELRKFTAVATVVDNFVPPPRKTPRPPGGGTPPPPTKIREHHQDRTISVQVVASGTAAESFDDCYKIVLVKAENVAESTSSKNDSSARTAKDTASTDVNSKDSKRKPEH